VLLAILMACWRWLTAPAEGLASPPVRVARAAHAATSAAPQCRRYGGAFFAPIQTPLPRLLS